MAGVGAASFFSDAGHEIATALLPSFVTHTLRGSAAALGLIEGISDALTGLAKVVAGPLANDQARRVQLATGGYLATAAATGAIGLATAVWQVGILRMSAWVARGVRSPARDSLLASLAPRRAYGRAFGLERAGDNLGAVAGPLAAAGLVAAIGIRPSIYFAAVPGAFAAVAIVFAASEARRSDAPIRRRYRLELRRLHRARLTVTLAPIALFEVGNCAATLLILRATGLLHDGGRGIAAATSVAVLIYAAHNLFGAVVAYAGGHWIDRVGPRPVFAAGAMLFASAYAGFAVEEHSWVLLLLFFVLAGSGIGLAEPAESAFIARLLPDELRGSGFGILGGVQSLGDFASSAAVGLIWAVLSPTAAFIYATGWMVLAALAALRSPHFRHSPEPVPAPPDD